MSLDFPTLLMTLLTTCVQVLLGVAIGWWLKTRHLNVTALVQKRVGALLSRVYDLTMHLGDDLREHSEHLLHVSQRLSPFGDDVNAHIDERVARAALADLSEANRQLQDRLAYSEQRLQESAQKAGLDLSSSHRDTLTGLPNRGAFEDELKRRFAESQRSQAPFTLLLVELDQFDKLNTGFGPEGADQVLQSVSALVGSIVREMDMVCRYSPSQLALILPSAGVPEVLRAAERVRTATLALCPTTSRGQTQVSVSLGIAEAILGDNARSLMRRALEALAAAECAGGNCCHCHDGSQCYAIDPQAVAQASGAGLPGKLAEEHRASMRRRRHDMRTAQLGPDAQVDPITGLPNRRAFVDELRSRAAEASRGKRPLSLLLVAVDHLDAIRSFHDQVAVDSILRAVAPAVCDTVREMDLVTRYGWEEFAVILPSTNMQEAIRAGERMIAAVSSQLAQFDYHFELSLSCGIAEKLPSEEATDFAKRADVALRASQQCGGNRTHLHVEGGVHLLPTPQGVNS